uniref:Uncharacterized protein n=1 Tax=Anguilla anguilla TaxID=7936 RepID=A0A0E9UA02_ANGAN
MVGRKKTEFLLLVVKGARCVCVFVCAHV